MYKVFGVSLGIVAGCGAQTAVKPAKTVEQLAKAVFKGSMEADPMSNFRLFLLLHP